MIHVEKDLAEDVGKNTVCWLVCELRGQRAIAGS